MKKERISFSVLNEEYSSSNPLPLEYFSIGSDKSVLWECSKGHEWRAKINNRTSGNGCPVCAGKIIIPGENDLASQFPEALKYWSKNNTLLPTEVSPGSRKKALWVCIKGHESEVAVFAKLNKLESCSYCSNKKVLAGYNDLATTHPQLLAEWGPQNALSPYSITAGSDKMVAWVCSQGHEWEARVFKRSQGRGCPVCAGKKVVAGVNDVATTHPSLVSEWHSNNTISPTEVVAGSNKKILWMGKCGHEWEADVYSRALKNGKCPYCSNQQVLAGSNDFATVHPVLAQQWSEKNDILPSEARSSSNRLVWWKCPQGSGHEWQSRISDRLKGGGCPYCSNRKIIPGENDLATSYPEIAKEWHKDNLLGPNQVSSGSDKKVRWKCSEGHEWKAHVKSRTYLGVGCPYCANQKVLPGYNDLLSKFPALGRQYSSDNQISVSEIAFASKRKVSWNCDQGHSWEATVYSRSMIGSGCPHCARKISRVETELADFIKALLPEVEVRTTVRDVINPKELDIYVPSKKLAVEFNGLYWHTEGQGKDKSYHRNKWQACHEQGIQLVQVWEDQWRDKKDVVKRMIAHKLGASQERRVFARKTKAVQVSKVEARDFLEAYHIQGFVSGSHYLALKDDNSEIVALMVLKKQGSEMLLARYATSCAVVGGQSKLVSYAEKHFSYDVLVTFADLEVSDGGLYESTGFVKDKELDPDYRYLYDGERKHKFGFRLKRFREDPDLAFVEGMSERELALLNGIERVWDSGKIRYVKKHPGRS